MPHSGLDGIVAIVRTCEANARGYFNALQNIACARSLVRVEREEELEVLIQLIGQVGTFPMCGVDIHACPSGDLGAELVYIFLFLSDAVSICVWESAETHKVDDNAEGVDIGFLGEGAEKAGWTTLENFWGTEGYCT